MYRLTPLSEQGSGALVLAEIHDEYVQFDPFIRAGSGALFLAEIQV